MLDFMKALREAKRGFTSSGITRAVVLGNLSKLAYDLNEQMRNHNVDMVLRCVRMGETVHVIVVRPSNGAMAELIWGATDVPPGIMYVVMGPFGHFEFLEKDQGKAIDTFIKALAQSYAPFWKGV